MVCIAFGLTVITLAVDRPVVNVPATTVWQTPGVSDIGTLHALCGSGEASDTLLFETLHTRILCHIVMKPGKT
jgi:hypothetical protein